MGQHGFPTRQTGGKLHPFQQSSDCDRPIQALLSDRVVQSSCGNPCNRAWAS